MATKTETAPESTEVETEAVEPEAELVNLEIGAFVRDSAGNVGVLIADDRERSEKGLAEGESEEPLIVWLGQPTPFGGDLTEL